MRKNQWKILAMRAGLVAAFAAWPFAGAMAAGYNDPNTQNKPEKAPSPEPDKTQSQPDSTGPKSSQQYPADNTGRNIRDAKGGTATPDDQIGSESDRKLVQKVRKSINDEKSLSVDAKNVKIVSVNGKLTLRGPVKSTAEKDLINRKACDIAGIENVDDQLEVVAK